MSGMCVWGGEGERNLIRSNVGWSQLGDLPREGGERDRDGEWRGGIGLDLGWGQLVACLEKGVGGCGGCEIWLDTGQGWISDSGHFSGFSAGECTGFTLGTYTQPLLDGVCVCVCVMSSLFCLVLFHCRASDLFSQGRV